MLPLSLILLAIPLVGAQTAIPLTIPTTPPSSAPSIPENFFGISIELSSLSYYLGSSGPSSIPSPFRLFLQRIAAPLSASAPFRVRIGGNSMDDSVYSSNQTQPPMLVDLDPDANDNDVPVSFGPLLFESLSALITPELNVSYSLGLSLRTPSDPSSFLPVAQACTQLLPTGSLDLLLLGNEPDLYFSHGDRPGYDNYTVTDYETDFEEEIEALGSLVDYPILGGPSICCEWSLLSLLQSSYLTLFSASLKSLSLQHYPQNNCGSTPPPFPLSYYLSHSGVVALAQWQLDGVSYALAQPNPVQVRMTEFNSASCGGIPGISDTFAATLWALDYALQLGSVGYEGAFVHTREPGVSYNVLQAPNTSDAAQLNSSWTAGTTYWPLVVLADTLGGLGSTAVMDLNLTDDSSAGYALYPSSSSSVGPARVVLINFSSTNASYTLPSPNTELSTRFLLAPNTSLPSPPISWAGQQASSQGDGTFVGAQQAVVSVCAGLGGEGCVVDVPGPGVAVVFLSSVSPNATSSSTGTGAPSGTGNLTGSGAGSTRGARTTINVTPTFSVGSPTVFIPDTSPATGTTTSGSSAGPTAGGSSGAASGRGKSTLVVLFSVCAYFGWAL